MRVNRLANPSVRSRENLPQSNHDLSHTQQPSHLKNDTHHSFMIYVQTKAIEDETSSKESSNNSSAIRVGRLANDSFQMLKQAIINLERVEVDADGSVLPKRQDALVEAAVNRTSGKMSVVETVNPVDHRTFLPSVLDGVFTIEPRHTRVVSLD